MSVAVLREEIKPEPPEETPLELERLRRAVAAKLFSRPFEPVVIGRYRVLEPLGGGGMGLVYLARDDELGRKVALKLLRPEMTKSPVAGGTLGREAKALARLSHPNVVAVYDVGEYEGQVFIAMEYVEGQTLTQWLRNGRHDLDEILEVFTAAGRGLEAAHERGLVHRDFKPDNVLVGNDRRPRILDFGLARPPDLPSGEASVPELNPNANPTATTLSVAGEMVGTPAYMAPEQHLGEPADARSDQFGFCVALYEAVHGERPFQGTDLRSLSLAIVRGRLTRTARSAHVPGWLDAILARGLSVDANARFNSMQELLEALRTKTVVGPSASLSAGELAEVEFEAGLPAGALGQPANAGGTSLVPVKASSVSTHLPPTRQHVGLTTEVWAEQTLELGFDAGATGVVVAEIERTYGRGRLDRLGSSLVFTGRGIEVHIDSFGPHQTRLRVCRKLKPEAQKRTRRGIFAGGFAGIFVGASMVEFVEFVGMGLLGPLEGLAFFVGVGGMATAGWLVSKTIHERHIETERKHARYFANRLAGLAAGHMGRALPPAEDQ